MIGLLQWLGCAALFDKTPPQLHIEEPDPAGAVRSLTLTLVARDDETGLMGATVSVDGAEPQPLALATPGAPGEIRIPFAPSDLPDGKHTFLFTVTDGARSPNTATLQAERTLDQTGPKIALAEASSFAHQGRTLAVWIRTDEPMSEPTLTMNARGDDGETKDRTVPLYEVRAEGFPEGTLWRALRGIELREALGPRPIVVEGKDALGNVGRFEGSVEIRATTFEEGGYIKLTKKQEEARKDQAAIDKMRAERNAAYAVAIPEQHWGGLFTKPVPEARLTSPFGKYRSYSDGRKSYHTGLDLSLELGAPVLSAAGGKVVVAHEMAIFGNVVIVHHGQGVCTSYNHLDTIVVKEGDMVTAGQQLGTLGSTGQSTGPHLHWGMEVAEVAVDPGEWLSVGFETPPAFP